MESMELSILMRDFAVKLILCILLYILSVGTNDYFTLLILLL